MTRSLQAWKGWAAVTVIIRVAVGQARFASQRRDKEQARFRAIRSANRPIWAVSVSVLVFSCVASTAVAGQRSSLHAHLETTRIEKKSGQSNGTTVASRGTRVDPPRCGPAGHAIDPNGEILALGSGYGTPGGSCPVQGLQRRLAATGYAPGPMDGLYGPLTGRAVRRFQDAYGLLVDGIAGPLTLTALAARTPVIHPGAGYASDGSAPVRVLQRRLARAGFRPGRVDGLYGPLTEQAVKRFQTSHGLSADGVAGPRTLKRLPDNAASHRRPSHQSRRKPTRPVPASPKTQKRPTPATQKPIPLARPKAERRPASGLGIGLILLIALGIAALSAAMLEAGRLRRRGRATTSPEPTLTDKPDPGTPGAGALEAAFDHGGELADHGDLVGAEAAYRRAAEGGHGDAASNLGVLLEERGDAEGAEAAYRRADALGSAGGALNLGGFLAQREDVAGAVAAYRRAVERGDAGSVSRLGELLEQERDLPGAEAVYSRAAQHGNPEAAFNLGRLLLERGEVESAVAAFRRAADGGDADAASNLGVLLEQRGDTSGAEAAYRQADEHGHAVGALNLGGLLQDRGDISGAGEAYLRARKRGDGDIASAARSALLRLSEGPKSKSPVR
jgi:peptidoglycan hydrolase-like protein with peptidoglycan-binding domain/TPR repeat protein